MGYPEQVSEPKRFELNTPEGLCAVVNPTGAYLESLVTADGYDLVFPYRRIDGKVRGGIPVCAPIFGPGEKFGLKQHGFARDLVWRSIDSPIDHPTKMRLELSEVTKQDETIPEVFSGCHMKLDLAISSEGATNILDMRLNVLNNGTESFPLFPGFHPYFNTSHSNPAAEVLAGIGNYVADLEKELDPAQELPQRAGPTNFRTGGQSVSITSPELSTVIVWSQSPQKYICVEPTYRGPAGSMSEEVLAESVLQPGAEADFSMKITWTERPEV